MLFLKTLNASKRPYLRQNKHPPSPPGLGRKRSVSHLSPPTKRTGSPADMTEPTHPSASEFMDAATKHRALPTWLKIEIAHAAAHTQGKEELPTWAWAEYQVIHDTHATTTKATRSFRKLPSNFESAQWRNARKLKTIERSLFPVSGPLGELRNLVPTPTLNPTMPDPSPLEQLAENIPVSSAETNQEMKEAEDDTPAWPTTQKLTKPKEIY
ncbi:hypothetical protein Q9L58_009367 [Maublancomyces gigas]|uniref:Uncharacterized protein n=1 Tax=Discina gigas TaxID=1032678 RepID=A0ABR3G751_9PEZI